jgi:DNA-binding LacI/PurR family transcriptional regulator
VHIDGGSQPAAAAERRRGYRRAMRRHGLQHEIRVLPGDYTEESGAPGGLSVVSYDDSDVARLSFVDLTTVRQDAALMAEHAVQAVIERLDHGRTEARDIVLELSLVVRGTTGPPRAGRG